jgi:hypothetical protein
MDRFSLVPWFWRALRGHSVTFAALFALGILGVSVVGWFRHVLRELGLPWWVWLVLPAVAVAVLARKEKRWLPEEERRRKWARGVVAVAIAAVMLMAKFSPKETEPVRKAGEPQGRARVPGR